MQRYGDRLFVVILNVDLSEVTFWDDTPNWALGSSPVYAQDVSFYYIYAALWLRAKILFLLVEFFSS